MEASKTHNCCNCYNGPSVRGMQGKQPPHSPSGDHTPPAPYIWPLTTPGRRAAILAHHAVAADLHPHRIAVAALISRVALHLGFLAHHLDVQ
jgi:hypothetical protein